MPRYPGLSDAPSGLSSRVYTSLLALAQQHAPEVFALNVGDTYLAPPEAAQLERLTRERPARLYNYADVRGEPALLDAIALDLERRERPVDKSCIQVTSGATSGLDIACRTLLSAGDEVIVLAPYWPLIRGILSAAGARVVELPLFTELRKPGFDLRAVLESACSERTAAIYVNHPHNPTGTVLRADEIEVLAEFSATHDLWLLSDEAYELLYFGEAAPAALWRHPKLATRSIVAHTCSKSFGMAGARVGFLHGPAEAMSAISNMQTYATYCAAKPMQQLAARALGSDDGQAWARDARRRYAEAAHETAEALRVPVPESGTFLLFDVTPYLRPGEDTMGVLTRCARAGVVLTPGAATGGAYGNWARLCFTAVAPDALSRALAALKRTLEA